MAIIKEIPPIMVLAEKSADRLVFRFRNRLWGMLTVGGGLALIAASAWFEFSHNLRFLQLAIFYFFGLLLLYSSLYSFTADQFLIVDGRDGSVHFHKRNLYGRVDWERHGDQFKGHQGVQAQNRARAGAGQELGDHAGVCRRPGALSGGK